MLVHRATEIELDEIEADKAETFSFQEIKKILKGWIGDYGTRFLHFCQKRAGKPLNRTEGHISLASREDSGQTTSQAYASWNTLPYRESDQTGPDSLQH